MAYTKNQDPWEAGDAVSLAVLDNFETIYTEISSYLASHTHDASYYTKAEMEATFWYAGNDGAASGSDADLIYVATGNLHTASFAGLGIPTGLVILWYGAIVDIPAGWALCNGSSGTIDLRDRMVVGAGTGSSYSPGDTGGAATFTASGAVTFNAHAITEAEMAEHRHPYTDSTPAGTYTTGTSTTSAVVAISSGNTSSAGSGNTHTHDTDITYNAVASLPYCYALAFIQKV